MDKNDEKNRDLSPVYVLNNTKNAIQQYLNWRHSFNDDRNNPDFARVYNRFKQNNKATRRQSRNVSKAGNRLSKAKNDIKSYIGSLQSHYNGQYPPNNKIYNSGYYKDYQKAKSNYRKQRKALRYQQNKIDRHWNKKFNYWENRLNNDRFQYKTWGNQGGYPRPTALQSYQLQTDIDKYKFNIWKRNALARLNEMKVANHGGKFSDVRAWKASLSNVEDAIKSYLHLTNKKGRRINISLYDVKRLPKLSKSRIKRLLKNKNRLIKLINSGGVLGNYKRHLQKLKNIMNRRKSGLRSLEKREMRRYYHANTIKNLRANPNWKRLACIRPVTPKSKFDYLYFFVTSEQPTHSNNATSNPVEYGRVFQTNTQKQPTTVQINGYIANNSDVNWHTKKVNGPMLLNYADSNNNIRLTPSGVKGPSATYHLGNRALKNEVNNKIHLLDKWSDDGDDIYYSGNDFYGDSTISNFSVTYDRSPGGAINAVQFSMTLTVADYFKSNVKSKKRIKRKGKTSRRRGRKHNQNGAIHYVIARGNNSCYSEISEHTGCPLSWLRSHNRYSDRHIPFGAHIRYLAPYSDDQNREHHIKRTRRRRRG